MWNTGGELNPPLLRGLQREPPPPPKTHTHTHIHEDNEWRLPSVVLCDVFLLSSSWFLDFIQKHRSHAQQKRQTHVRNFQPSSRMDYKGEVKSQHMTSRHFRWGFDLLMLPLPPATPRWIFDERWMADARQQGVKEEGVGMAGVGPGWARGGGQERGLRRAHLKGRFGSANPAEMNLWCRAAWRLFKVEKDAKEVFSGEKNIKLCSFLKS